MNPDGSLRDYLAFCPRHGKGRGRPSSQPNAPGDAGGLPLGLEGSQNPSSQRLQARVFRFRARPRCKPCTVWVAPPIWC